MFPASFAFDSRFSFRDHSAPELCCPKEAVLQTRLRRPGTPALRHNGKIRTYLIINMHM